LTLFTKKSEYANG